MGSGEMAQWFIGKMEFGIKLIIATLPFIINLPIFHYSNIPRMTCPPRLDAQARRVGRGEII